jgi:galactose mutarotase-like enzyme
VTLLDASPAVRRSAVEGFDAVTVSAGPLEATFVPAAGMAGASLRHDGEELLDRREGVAAYAATGATMGLPFLHPWANRLEGDRYVAAGRAVRVPSTVPRDERGLPIHGVLPRPFAVCAVGAHGRAATVSATLDCPALDAFPFPHRVEQRITLDPGGLTVATVLTAGRAGAVPVAFGFHPYLRACPGWTVELPARRRLLTDAHQIPDGDFAYEPAERLALGARALDDGYDGLGRRPRFSLTGAGRTVGVTFLAGYPVAQVYAPAGRDLICFEPMTAPANALASGRGLRLLAPGASLAAAFAVRVDG